MAGTTSALDCPHCGAENVGALFIVDGATFCGYCKPADLESQLAAAEAERVRKLERVERECRRWVGDDVIRADPHRVYPSPYWNIAAALADLGGEK
jgi:uncharacterized Zn finger protein (UPF0148 family)